MSREFALGKNSQIGRGFGMIASRKRLGRRLTQTSRKKEKRTWLWSVRTRGAKDRVLNKEGIVEIM